MDRDPLMISSYGYTYIIIYFLFITHWIWDFFGVQTG